MDKQQEKKQSHVVSRQQLDKIRKKLLEMSHKAAMAEVSASILHKIGNITTSIIVSMEKIESLIKQSRIDNLLKANSLLIENTDNLVEFLTTDEKGRLLPRYFQKLGEALAGDYRSLEEEMQKLSERVYNLRNEMDSQQEYAYSSSYLEDLYLVQVIEDALRIEKSLLYRAGVEVEKSLPDPETVIVAGQKSKLLDIFINLFRNACEAMAGNEGDRRLIITVDRDEKNVYATVADNGRGISRENLEKIFDFGFTTRPDGFGFGLHSCVILLQRMQARITAESAGPGRGAGFQMIFPRRC